LRPSTQLRRLKALGNRRRAQHNNKKHIVKAIPYVYKVPTKICDSLRLSLPAAVELPVVVVELFVSDQASSLSLFQPVILSETKKTSSG